MRRCLKREKERTRRCASLKDRSKTYGDMGYRMRHLKFERFILLEYLVQGSGLIRSQHVEFEKDMFPHRIPEQRSRDKERIFSSSSATKVIK